MSKKEKKTKLTTTDVKKYINNGGNHCPFCESTDLVGGFNEVIGTKAHQGMSCNECGKEWTDVYQLIDIIRE